MTRDKFPLVAISDIKASLMSDEPFMAGEPGEHKYFKVHVDVLNIQARDRLWYTACPECKKKINPVAGDRMSEFKGSSWYCERCSKHFDEPNLTYNFAMKVGDMTDVIYAQVLSPHPGNEVIGKTAKELRELAMSDGSV